MGIDSLVTTLSDVQDVILYITIQVQATLANLNEKILVDNHVNTNISTSCSNVTRAMSC